MSSSLQDSQTLLLDDYLHLEYVNYDLQQCNETKHILKTLKDNILSKNAPWAVGVCIEISGFKNVLLDFCRCA